MMVSAPGITPGRSSATVMEMDLLPTIVSLAGVGVAVPACPVQVMASRAIDLCTDGHDLIPLLRDPTHGSWDHPAFGQFPRPEHPNKGPDLTNTSVNKMGYTVRTNVSQNTRLCLLPTIC
jgi:arylsulfatase A-like enzyme